MNKVIPLAITTVDWKSYLELTRVALGRNILRPVDLAHQKSDDVAAFITSLSQIVGTVGSYVDLLRGAGALLKHVHMSLLVLSDDDQLARQILEASNLAVLSTETQRKNVEMLIVSGCLEQWRTAIINGCSLTASESFRDFVTECLSVFDREGLRELFADYRRVNTPAGVFVLEKKGK